MSVINANPLMLGDAGYNIERSLRFRSSASAYLNRTFGSGGSRTTWTYSCWVKRGDLGVNQAIFSCGTTTASGLFQVYFEDVTNTIRISNFPNSGTPNVDLIPSAVYRDISAWYHVVVVMDTTQATSSNRVKLYVNGSQVTAFSTATYPAQNATPNWNTNALTHCIGARSSTALLYSGYMAEVNFIDGQALTPSSFGETDAITGVWIPKKYTGTYGTNGFYLDFKDNTSATTLAYDKSGNGNNWTANNISTTAGATYDSMTDVPTLTSTTAANYCTLNPLDNYNTGATLSDGNLKWTIGAADGATRSTFFFTTGKWYAEFIPSGYIGLIGIEDAVTDDVNGTPTIWYMNDGNKRINGSVSSYGASYTVGSSLIGMAVDADAGTVTFYKDNVSQGSINLSSAGTSAGWSMAVGSGSGSQTAIANFGQRPFSYTPPTGFKALNTFNLPDPVIKKPNQYMDANLWTGNGSTQTITNAGSFAPDLVWIKARSIAVDHQLGDTIRGATKTLNSNATAVEQTIANGLTAFNSNGFSLGAQSDFNNNGSTYVAWQWKKGATPGFDIVTYTGTGVARTVAHSLGVAPSMVIIKNRDSAQNWTIYHKDAGATYRLRFTTDARTLSPEFNNTAPTSSVFSVDSTVTVNENTKNHVAYLFSEIPGFSKFGSYTGNGSADGSFVYLGFQPSFIMVKMSSSTGNWTILDNKRLGYNVDNNPLYPNLSNAEGTTDLIDITSNGFKIRTTDASVNTNGGTYIYAAFASSPFKTSLAR